MPQNSAHLILYVPAFSAWNHVWFVLPGMASILPPKAGTHQLCATSAETTSSVTTWSFGTVRTLIAWRPLGYLNSQ